MHVPRNLRVHMHADVHESLYDISYTDPKSNLYYLGFSQFVQVELFFNAV